MSRVCVACKKPIPATEDCWRDMEKRYCCKRCYHPQPAIVRVRPSE
jgi:hypothetical protein